MIGLLAGLLWIGLGGISPEMAKAATTERVVINRFSGLAIEGYDPVAYFVDARPTVGLPDFEASEAGAVWRFRNEGNRASFAAHPDIYGPQFGGYDPVDVARVLPTPEIPDSGWSRANDSICSDARTTAMPLPPIRSVC